MELVYRFKPKDEKVQESTTPRAPLERRPIRVRGHVTETGAVVDPYMANRNVRVEQSNGPKYKNFTELAAGENRGTDYEVSHSYKGPSKYGIFGIHGGKISEVITHLTRKIAGDDLTQYVFQARKARGNGDLILPGYRFNEPEALELAHKTPVVVSLAISQNRDKKILVDGRNEYLADELSKSLKEKGFQVVKPFSSHLNGHKKSNIANQGTHEMGVQIQLPKDLRMEMTRELEGPHPNGPNTLLSKFTEAVRGTLDGVTPDRSVIETEHGGTAAGRARTPTLYIGEFSDLAKDKKQQIAQSIIETNDLHGMTPEGMISKLKHNTVFVAFDRQNNKLQAAAGLKKLKDRLREKITEVFEGSSNDPNARLLVDRHNNVLQEFMGNIERGYALEYGWATNKARDKDKFRSVLGLLFKDAERKGHGKGSIFAVVNSENARGLEHQRKLGFVPMMEFSSPYTESKSKLVLHVFKGRP